MLVATAVRFSLTAPWPLVLAGLPFLVPSVRRRMQWLGGCRVSCAYHPHMAVVLLVHMHDAWCQPEPCTSLPAVTSVLAAHLTASWAANMARRAPHMRIGSRVAGLGVMTSAYTTTRRVPTTPTWSCMNGRPGSVLSASEPRAPEPQRSNPRRRSSSALPLAFHSSSRCWSCSCTRVVLRCSLRVAAASWETTTRARVRTGSRPHERPCVRHSSCVPKRRSLPTESAVSARSICAAETVAREGTNGIEHSTHPSAVSLHDITRGGDPSAPRAGFVTRKQDDRTGASALCGVMVYRAHVSHECT